MSAIDPAALAAARERLNARLERASKAADFVDASVADLRIVLDALRDARRQAFEEAALLCHRKMNGLAVEDRDEEGRLAGFYHTEGSAVAEECATEIYALAEVERSEDHKEQA